jgi:hypothetical protein
MAYTGSYVLAYGVVYAAVLVTRQLPDENAVIQGLRDGGRAALAELDYGKASTAKPAQMTVVAAAS